MKEQFCNYEISLKLKELGFDESCICKYNSYGVLKHTIASTNPDIDDEISIFKYDDRLSAPLYQQIIDYFREEYKLHLSIYRLNDNWVWQIFDIERNCYITEMTVRFSEIKRSYEECRDHIILKAIELCQNKK